VIKSIGRHRGWTAKQNTPRVAANKLQFSIASLCLNAKATELTRWSNVKERNQTFGGISLELAIR